MDGFIIKLKEKQRQLVGVKEENSFVKSITFAFVNKFKVEYGTEEEAYKFATKQLADYISKIVKGDVIGETRQKKIKEANNKDKWVQLNPPTLEEVVKYCKEKDLNLNAEEVYKYYVGVEWTDKNGNKIMSWKLKLNTISQLNDKKGTNYREHNKGKVVKKADETGKVKNTIDKKAEKEKEIEDIIKANEDLIESVSKNNPDNKKAEGIVKRAREIIENKKKELEELKK